MLLSRNTYGKNSENLHLLANAGFNAVDINDTCDPHIYHKSDDEQFEYFKQVIFSVNNAGLKVCQCHAPMTDCYNRTTPEQHEYTLKSIEKCVQVASELYIPYVVVHPLIFDWSFPDPDFDSAWQRNIDFLRRITKYAENTTVCLENMPGKCGFIKTGNDMANMLRDAAIDNLMVCLDTGHLFCQNEKATDFFAAVGNRIKVTHIHDSIPGQDLHLLACTGQGDWKDFKNAIKLYNYQGNLNSESNFYYKLPQTQRLEGQILERKILEGFMSK